MFSQCLTELLWRQRLSDGHREVQGMLLLSTSFLQHEHLLAASTSSMTPSTVVVLRFKHVETFQPWPSPGAKSALHSHPVADDGYKGSISEPLISWERSNKSTVAHPKLEEENVKNEKKRFHTLTHHFLMVAKGKWM